jgi:hypothetical protein
MKKPINNESTGLRQALRLTMAGLLACWALAPAWAAKPPPQAMDDGFSFAVIGDHRGDNKKANVNAAKTAYKDGGITKPVLINIASALAAEKVAFAVDVGDMATKWQTGFFVDTVTSNSLLAAELADWADLWKTHSGNLPIYPVRGNQEVSASKQVWRDFLATLPGISALPLNGPEGEQGLTYAFKYKNCLFVGIDQYATSLANNDAHYITPEAMAWLEWVLPESSHKFVYGHVPAFEVWDPKAAPFTAIKDGLASPYALFNGDSLAQRDAFWDLLGKHKANYFCGHDHIYTRSLCIDTQDRWVRQVIIGNGGAPPPAMFSTAYTDGWCAEAYAGVPFPTVPGFSYELLSPLVVTESMPTFGSGTSRAYGYGYVVINVHGSKVTARYMAEPAAEAGFVEVDSWTIAE